MVLGLPPEGWIFVVVGFVIIWPPLMWLTHRSNKRMERRSLDELKRRFR